MTTDSFAPARLVIEEGLADAAFPAAVVDVGSSTAARWSAAFGRLTFDEAAPPATLETIFDLASLTKVIATASIAMSHVSAGRLDLDAPVGRFIDDWPPGDHSAITVRQLLDHSSGLPAHLRAWTVAAGREAYASLIAKTPLERPISSSAVYSDLGFILLGLVLERIGGAPLDRQFAALMGRALEPEPSWRSGRVNRTVLEYRPQAHLYERTAPTEFDAWRGRVLCGEVHDENAAAIGGVSGHAGLFGTADAVGRFVRLVMQTFQKPTVLGAPDVMKIFASRSAVPGSSRALAWDTALASSSCGRYASATAIGHTGFTGTSIWIDWERDRYAVLLTNRVHPTRANQKLIPLRRAFHEALWKDD
jgi:CubicO group peptidase (beta-lactamase class C family)